MAMQAKFTYTTSIDKGGNMDTESATLSIERYGRRGWIWTTDGGDSHGSTNEEGEGLWDGTRQERGTMQYHLPAKPSKAIRVLVRQHIKSRAAPGCGQIKSLKIVGATNR